MFMGTYEHRLDSKARLVLPAKIREKLGSTVVVSYGLDNCVALYSEEGWGSFSEKINNLPVYSNPKLRDFSRIMVGCAYEMPIDGTNRVLLPAQLRDYAKLGQEVVVSGAGDHVEIWDKDIWESKRNFVLENLSEFAKDVGF